MDDDVDTDETADKNELRGERKKRFEKIRGERSAKGSGEERKRERKREREDEVSRSKNENRRGRNPLKHSCSFHLADIIDVFCHPYFSTPFFSTHRHGGVDGVVQGRRSRRGREGGLPARTKRGMRVAGADGKGQEEVRRLLFARGF